MSAEKQFTKNELEQMRDLIHQLSSRLNAQEVELEKLRSLGQAQKSAPQGEKTSLVTSRRNLLKKLGIAAGIALSTASVSSFEAGVRNVEASDPVILDFGGTIPVSSAASVVKPAGSFGSSSPTVLTPTVEIDAEAGGFINGITQFSGAPRAALLTTASNQDFGIVAVTGTRDVNSADLKSTYPIPPASVQGRSGSSDSTGYGSGNIGLHGISDTQSGVLGQFGSIETVTQNLQINPTLNSGGVVQAGVIGASDYGAGVVAASSSYAALYASAAPAASNTQATGYSIYAARGAHTGPSNTLDPTKLNLAALFIEPSTEIGPPTSNGHQAGEIHVDAIGKVYICTGGGNFTAPPPGVRVPAGIKKPSAQVPNIPSRGNFNQLSSFVALPNILRIIGPSSATHPDYLTLQHQVPVYLKLEGSFTNNPPNNAPSYTYTVPSTVSAVIGTVATISPANPGYLTVFPADQPAPNAVTMGFAAGSFVSTGSFITRLGLIPVGYPDAGKLGIGIVAFNPCQITLDLIGHII